MEEAGRRILIVDDEEQNRILLKLFCKKWGYETLEAENGHEAIDVAKRERPNLILMDAMMPGMDGFETTKRIKGEPELRDIPVVMITALDSEDGRLRTVEQIADAILTKPIDMERLRACIENVLRSD